MSFLSNILALLPDNVSKRIKPADLRASFEYVYEDMEAHSATLPPGTNGQIYEIDNDLSEKIKPTNRLTEVEAAAASALTTLSGVLEELADIEQNKANKDASAMLPGHIISWQEALQINELQINLQAQIDAEKTARENGDIAEANARAFADGILQSNINAEATARQNADDLKQDKSMFSALVDKWIHYYDSATQKMQPILKFVSGVVNQLEFTGRIKADAIVLPNNTNPVVANRLRSDGSRLKYANNSAVEKDIAYVEDLSNGSSLVQRYLHTSNIVLVPTAVDYAAGTVTVPSHGLSIGTVYQAGGVPNSFANGSLENVDWACIPFEWTTNFCRLKPIDGNTIQILNNASVLITVNPVSTDNNGKLDFAKWHMEIFSQVSINNFPIGIKSAQVKFFGMMVNASTDQAFRLHLYNSSGDVFTNIITSDQAFGSADRLRYYSGSVVGLALFNITFDFTIYAGINRIFFTGFNTIRSAGLNTFSFFGINSTNTSFSSKILKVADNIGLANLTSNTTSTIFNNSIIEIYKA